MVCIQVKRWCRIAVTKNMMNVTQLMIEMNPGNSPRSAALYITSNVPAKSISITEITGKALEKNSDFSLV